MGMMAPEKKKPALVIALGKGGGDEGDSDDRDPEDVDDDIDISDDEVEAAKAMRAAKSDEEYAKALKAFIKLCEEY